MDVSDKDKDSHKVLLQLQVDNTLRVMAPLTGSVSGRAIVPSAITFGQGTTISDPLPGESLRNLVAALSPVILRNRFDIRRPGMPTRSFEVDSELQARTWIAVLSVRV